MSKRWIVILLFVSLAFNLAVMGMFLHTMVFRRPLFCLPGMIPHMEWNKERDHRTEKDKDRPRFDEETRAEIKKLRGDFMLKRREFMLLLAKKDLNEQQVTAAMEASILAQDKLEKKLGSAILELRKKMTAEQANDFFTRMLERKNEDNRPDYHRSKRIDKEDNTKGETQ